MLTRLPGRGDGLREGHVMGCEVVREKTGSDEWSRHRCLKTLWDRGKNGPRLPDNERARGDASSESLAILTIRSFYVLSGNARRHAQHSTIVLRKTQDLSGIYYGSSISGERCTASKVFEE
jgi:hypothetical protein